MSGWLNDRYRVEERLFESRIGRYIVRMIGVLNKPCCCGYNGWIRVMQQTSCVSIV